MLGANAATMRELTLATADDEAPPAARALAALLRAAPGLRVLQAGASCWGADALSVLRNEPPFGPLRLTSVVLGDVHGWPAVADGLPVQASLERVWFNVAWPTVHAESDALVAAPAPVPAWLVVFGAGLGMALGYCLALVAR